MNKLKILNFLLFYFVDIFDYLYKVNIKYVVIYVRLLQKQLNCYKTSVY